MLFVILSVILISAVSNSTYICMVGALVLWAIGMLFAFSDIKKRFVLFSFFSGFMVFLLGGVVLNYLVDGDFEYLLGSVAGKKHACFAMMLSLGVIDFYKKNIVCLKKNELIVNEQDNNMAYMFDAAANETAKIALAPSFDLFSVPSI